MVDLITETIGRFGYLGVAMLMFLETLIPPIPSEVIMPLVGVAAARGELNIVGAIVAAVIGSTAGASAWYGIARAYGRARMIGLASRYGRWLGLSPGLVDQATAWFAREGGWAIFLARILPGMRVYISVPAGLADMSFARFLAFTLAGYAVWYGFLGLLGYGLGEWVDAGSLWIIALGSVVVIWPASRVLRRLRGSKGEQA